MAANEGGLEESYPYHLGIIPKAWHRAEGVVIPKEKESTDISQFRPISLLNVEGKIYFSLVA